MAIIYWKVDGTTLKLRSGSASGYSDFDDEFPGTPDWTPYITNVTKVIIENNISPSNTYAWFMDCSKVTEIQYIQRINTSNVTDMSNMFRNCYVLTSLDLSNFNTSNVTHMGSMFHRCPALASLNISNFNTSKVTNMGSMFRGCASLTSLDLSSFDTSNVTDMGYMFDNCQALTTLDLSSFNTSNVTNMNNMFVGCLALTSLTLSESFNTSKVTDMSYMFNDCKALTSLDVSGFNTSNVTNMNNMFSNCRALTSLDLSNFNTSNVTTMGNIFSDCWALASLDLSNFNTSKVTYMGDMFNNCRALTSFDLSDFDTSNVTNMIGMFQSCYALTSLDLSSFDTSNVTIMIGMFQNCYTLTFLDLSSFDTSNVTSMYGMFSNCQALTTIIVSSALFKTTQVTSSSNMFSGCTNLIGGRGTSYDSSYIDKTYACADDAPTTPGYFTGVANCASFDSTDGTLEIFYTGAAHTNGEVVDTKTYYTGIEQITGNTTPKWYSIRNSITKVTIEDLFKPKTGYYLFSSILLEEIEGIEYLNTSNVTSMYGMFCNCQALTSLDLSGFNTSNVTDMGYMFEYCRTLTSLDLSDFDTSSVTDMGYMFSDCRALTSLNVSSFDTLSVINMSAMFYRCEKLISTSLTPLDLSSFDTSNVTDMGGMFYGCKALEYLNLSEFNTSNVIRMANMFQYCEKLDSLNLSNFNTSKVTNITSMFYGCKELQSLYINSFNTSNVISMNHLFYDCENLASLNVSNFDTSKATNMEQMFKNCSSLTSLNISNFVFSNNVNINSMFEGCTSLAGAIQINSNPGSYTDMFKNTVEEIVLLGNSTLLNSFVTTANNHNVYVWTLTAQPTANRDNNVGTSANLSVKIESYAITNNNIIRAIKVYEGDSTNPLGLTWDKQFTIDENPKTFTTTITNIDENATVTYRIQVEDNYGVSAFREVIVPTNYYTIDFLKKGKEISFGEKANIDDFYEVLTTIPDDWASNYYNYYKKEGDEYISNTDVNFVSGNYYKKIHESLFKCGMDAVFLTETQLFKSMYDIMHPIGSYYESSLTYIPPSQMSQQTPDLDNPTSEDLKALGITWFNPNFIWSGRWELELAGQVHVSSGTGYMLGTVGGSPYIQEHSHSYTAPTLPAHVHGMGDHTHNSTSGYYLLFLSTAGNHAVNRRSIKPGSGTAISNIYYGENAIERGSVIGGMTSATNTGNPTSYPSCGGSIGNVSGASTGDKGNMPPYIVVNRWHRVA